MLASHQKRTARVRFTRIAAAVTLLAGLASCSALGSDSSNAGQSSGGKLEKNKIKVGVLPVVDVAPFYYAIENNYFKDLGLEVEPVVMASGQATINGVLNGDIDVAFSTYPPPILAQSKGAGDFKIIADGLAAKPGHLVVAAKPDSALKKPQDAPGRKIAITATKTISELGADEVLKSLGVDYTKVEWVQMAFPDMIPALANNQIDGAVLAEPWVTIAEKKVGAVPVFDCAPASSPTADLPMSGWVAAAGSGKFATSDPNTVAAFQKGLAKAQAQAGDRSKTEPMFVKYANVDAETAKLVTLSTYPTSIDATRIQRVANLMEEFALLDKHVDVSSMILSPSS